MKKNTTKTLAALALAGALLTSPLTAMAASFKDIDANHWAYSHISKLSDLRIIKGYDDGTYKPTLSVTYLEILELLKGVQAPSTTEMTQAISTYGYIANSYKVPAWAKPAVCIALQNNVITEANLKAAYKLNYIKDVRKDAKYPSREVAMVYYAKALGIQPKTDISNIKVTDIDSIGKTSKELIGDVNVKGLLASMIDTGIFNEFGVGKEFKPNVPLQRDQMAKITDLSYEYKQGKTFEGDVTASTVNNNFAAFSIKDKAGNTLQFVTNQNTTITLNGKAAKAEDITVGSSVKVKAQAQATVGAPYQAITVEVIGNDSEGTGLIEGFKNDEIQISYSTKKDVVVDSSFKGDKTGSYKVDKNTVLTSLGKKVDMRALSTRDMIVFKARNGALREATVFPYHGIVSGEFVNYEYNRFGTSRIVLKLENNKEQEFIVKEEKTAKDLFELTNKLSKGYPITLTTRYKEVISGKEAEGKLSGFYQGIDLDTFGAGTLKVKTESGETKGVLLNNSITFKALDGTKKTISPYDVARELNNKEAFIELELVGGKAKSITVTAVLTKKDLEAKVEDFNKVGYYYGNGPIIGSANDLRDRYTEYEFQLDKAISHFDNHKMVGLVENAQFDKMDRSKGKLKLIYNLYENGSSAIVADIRVSDGYYTIPLFRAFK